MTIVEERPRSAVADVHEAPAILSEAAFHTLLASGLVKVSRDAQDRGSSGLPDVHLSAIGWNKHERRTRW